MKFQPGDYVTDPLVGGCPAMTVLRVVDEDYVDVILSSPNDWSPVASVVRLLSGPLVKVCCYPVPRRSRVTRLLSYFRRRCPSSDVIARTLHEFIWLLLAMVVVYAACVLYFLWSIYCD